MSSASRTPSAFAPSSSGSAPAKVPTAPSTTMATAGVPTSAAQGPVCCFRQARASLAAPLSTSTTCMAERPSGPTVVGRAGTLAPLVVLRGGSGNPSEVSGRCAHAKRLASRRTGTQHRVSLLAPATPTTPRSSLTFPGPSSPSLPQKLKRDLVASLATIIPADRFKSEAGEFRIDRVWRWMPIGNEELLVGAGCARTGARASCGIVVARPRHTGARASSHSRPRADGTPLLKIDDDRRVLWLFGVDDRGQFPAARGVPLGKRGSGRRRSRGRARRKRRRRSEAQQPQFPLLTPSSSLPSTPP